MTRARTCETCGGPAHIAIGTMPVVSRIENARDRARFWKLAAMMHRAEARRADKAEARAIAEEMELVRLQKCGEHQHKEGEHDAG